MNKFLQLFLNLFKKAGDSVIGIDVGASSIKVVQLRKRGGQAVLETYGELALGPYGGTDVGRAAHLPVDKLSEALVDVLRETNITTKRCGISIPLTSSLVSLIEMPAVDNKQLEQMIPIEARKYIPVPITEITLDWWIIPKTEDTEAGTMQATTSLPTNPTEVHVPKIEVLVVAIHNEAISKYQELVRRNGLDSSFFEIEIFSTMRSVLSADSSATVMVFDMGASATKLYIIDRGVVRVSHTINRGSQDVTLALSRGLNISVSEAEQIKRTQGLLYKKADNPNIEQVMSSTINFILSEANRVLLTFERKYNKSVGSIILSGGGVNIKGFTELASKSFQVPFIMGDPFSKLDAPAFMDPVLKTAGPEFAVAIGIALRRLQELG